MVLAIYGTACLHSLKRPVSSGTENNDTLSLHLWQPGEKYFSNIIVRWNCTKRYISLTEHKQKRTQHVRDATKPAQICLQDCCCALAAVQGTASGKVRTFGSAECSEF